MSKRKETLEIESKLHYMCEKRRIYGCEEVTIGFVHNGHGNEIVDYCTMDSKGIIRCYEIKVTLADLKSKAKKSWYGHYNYLFVTQELLHKIYNDLDKYIPDYVGVAVPCPSSWSDGVEIRRSAKKQELSQEDEIMLKDSLIRSMSYKLIKYRNACDMDKVRSLQSDVRNLEKRNKKYYNENQLLERIVSKIERILRNYYDYDIDLREIVSLIENKKILLPDKINLSLTQRGKKMNDIIRKDKNDYE